MKLSIITISFNAEKYIAKTIESVLTQTVPVYEYIMIDGLSKDYTYSIICSYDNEFKKRGIRFIHLSEPDRGISDAFNKGIARATGDLIGIINADDELLPKTNQILCDAWENEKADVYYGNCWWVDTERHIEFISRPKHDLDRLLYSMILIHPSTFVTKTAYTENGGFNEEFKYCMDKELLYGLYKAGKKFKYIDKELTRFKAGGVSDTHTRAVFREGTKMALSYGEPYIKVKVIEMQKTLKDIIVRLLKDTIFYRTLKNAEELEEEN